MKATASDHRTDRPAPTILAAGLTPAWQQIVMLDELQVGEVNRAREVRWCASGKVLNVGLALHFLGASAKTLSLVGGKSGAAIKEEFEHLALNASLLDSPTPTRVCTTILDATAHTTTELVENSAPATREELDLFLSAFAREATGTKIVVLSGSLPAGTPATFYRDLIQECPAQVILDVRGEELLAALPTKPFLVKPNREELRRTLGIASNEDTAVLEAMRELNRRGAEWVVITQGKQAVLATHGTETYRSMPPPVKLVVNPIGCGDCMAAGIAWALQREAAPLDAIRWGMAAAADNLSQLLPARLEQDRLEAILPRIMTERIG